MPTTRRTADDIATYLRQQIEQGVLAPGDRVPSARAIVSEYGVALATASRVHGLLRQAQLTEARTGVGTVVRRPAIRRPTSDAGALTTSRLVARGIAVADTEGIEGVTMRRLAAELGVGAMSLYRHVSSKEDLVERMLDAALHEWHPPPGGGAGWRECLEAAARGLWTLMRRHPWVAPALSMTRPQVITGGLQYTEWVLDALNGLDLDISERFDIHLTLFSWVRGLAISLESESAATAMTGMDAEHWMDTRAAELRAVASSGPYPGFAALVDRGYDFSLDRIFERGLAQLLDGLDQQLSHRS